MFCRHTFDQVRSLHRCCCKQNRSPEKKPLTLVSKANECQRDSTRMMERISLLLFVRYFVRNRTNAKLER